MTGGYWNMFVSELFITKLFLCRQVDLIPVEYHDNGDSIFFKVRNITIRDFRRVNVKMNSLLMASNNSNTTLQTIRICLNEFQHTFPFDNAKRSVIFFDTMLLTVVGVGIQLPWERIDF